MKSGDGHNYGKGKCPRCGTSCGYEDGVPDCSCPDLELYPYQICHCKGEFDECDNCEWAQPHERCRRRHVCPATGEVVYGVRCNDDGEPWEG